MNKDNLTSLELSKLLSENETITFRGVSKTIVQWSEQINVCKKSIESRLRRGWTIERTLTATTNTHTYDNCPFNPKNK